MIASFTDVSRETRERLDIYLALLRKWNSAINLVAPASVQDAAERHFRDSMQLWPLRGTFHHWTDLGSGAGFPGLVLAILALEGHTEARFTLVEADRRKAAFLETVVRETGAKAEVVVDRIERLSPLAADVISARALARLPQLLEWAAPHFSNRGVGLFLKGADADAEVREALASWRFSVQKVPSQTDPSGVILKLGDITRA